MLPIGADHHANITLLRVIPLADGNVLTTFLRDSTWYEGIHAGFLAVCERVPDENWFVATVFREWLDLPYQCALPMPIAD